jgi:RNA polymerase sigma-70 factor (ECF subfamily)
VGDVLDWVAVNAEQHPEHAFLALYDRSVDDVHRYASRLTGGDRARAEELVQETYLGVLRRLHAGDDLDLSTGYLIAACRSRFLDDLKAADRRHRREMRAALGARPGTDDPADRAVHAATDALAALPPDQRAALVLRYVDDLAVPDVARHLDRSIHATESLLARARAALRAHLGGAPS